MAAPVDIVELGLGHGVVDVDGREQQRPRLLHLVQALDACGRLLGDADHPLGHARPLLAVLREAVLDDLEHDLELGVVGGGRVGQRAVLLEGGLGLDTLVDEQRRVAAVVDEQVGAFAVLPRQHLLRAPPVLLERLALPGEDGGGVAGDGGRGVVLKLRRKRERESFFFFEFFLLFFSSTASTSRKNPERERRKKHPKRTCVEKMLHEHQRTSAPSAVSVSMSTAVCTVICSEPAMRAPLKGCAPPNSARQAIRPGISASARSISRRPKSACEMSLTLYCCVVFVFVFFF